MANKEFDNVQLFAEYDSSVGSSVVNVFGNKSKENIAYSLSKIKNWFPWLVPTNGSAGQILEWYNSVPTWRTNTNANTVKQTPSTDTNYHPLLIGYPNSSTRGFTPSEVTQQAYTNTNLFVKPDNGTLYAAGYFRTDITGQTVNLNHLTLSDGNTHVRRYIERTDDGSNNITNMPITGKPFLLEIELIRWASSTDYITRQLFTNANNPNEQYVRYCTNGTWGSWTIRVFTDTKVTSVGNHYAPTEDATAIISKDASSLTDATWGTTSFVTGVDVKRDAKGHVVDIALDSIKMPANPVPSDVVTGSGTAGYLTKWSGTHTVTDGPQLGSSTTTFLRNDGTWATPVDTNYYHKTGTWNGLTYTAAKVGSPEDLAFTIPTGTTSTTVALGNHTHAYTVPVGIVVKTGSSDQSHITLQTLMTWLITTKGYITSNTARSLTLYTSWSYAGNDILQLTIDGTAYELQLAGVIIEFDGYASDYQTGTFRLRIHSSPTVSFTPASGYTQFPASHIAEYTCNGSGYSPTWKMIATTADLSSYIPTSMLTVTKNTNVGITPSSNVFGYVSGLTAAAWNFQQSAKT